VVAIIAVVTGLATVSLARARPRANLASAATELHALVHGARQQALATGRDVAVLIFPASAAPGGATGRVVVYEDGDFTLFDDTAAVNFDDLDPAETATGPRSTVVTRFDLPVGVTFGPRAGIDPITLVAPYSGIPVDAECTFCEGAGAARRGAVVFDSHGRARFHSKNGPPLDAIGGSLHLTAPELGDEIRTLVVGGSTGSVRSLTNG